MSRDPPEIDSRLKRLRTYLVYNGEQMLVDGLIMTAWILVCWTGFAILGWPRWFFYLVLFAGITIYSRITKIWERPYRSPDL